MSEVTDKSQSKPEPGFEICEFCGCQNNKLCMRTCCDRGRKADELAGKNKCRYCGASRVTRPSGEWQFACKCDDPDKRPTKQGPGEFTRECYELIPKTVSVKKLKRTLYYACDRLDRRAEQFKTLEIENAKNLGDVLSLMGYQKEHLEQLAAAKESQRTAIDLEDQLADQKAEARKYGREITEARQGAFGFMIRGDETLWQGMTRNYQEFYDERERLNKQLAAKDKETERLKKVITDLEWRLHSNRCHI